MITIGSLFSGIGGLERGLELAGLGPVRWQVENNEFCVKVLAKHWPDATRHADIRNVRPGSLEPVHLICGGFPCQPHSKAGKRLGRQDDQWLWPEFARVLGLVRPRFVVVENVPGLLTSDDGNAFADVLGSLASLGYDAWWDCLRASDVGAPHQRERLFVVAWVPLAHTDGKRKHEPQGCIEAQRGWATDSRARISEPEVVRDPDGLSGRLDTYWPANRWKTPYVYEPSRTAPNVSNRTQRLRALGNAVVPQCAYVIGNVVQALSETLS